jgi:hypothetical protein
VVDLVWLPIAEEFGNPVVIGVPKDVGRVLLIPKERAQLSQPVRAWSGGFILVEPPGDYTFVGTYGVRKGGVCLELASLYPFPQVMRAPGLALGIDRVDANRLNCGPFPHFSTMPILRLSVVSALRNQPPLQRLCVVQLVPVWETLQSFYGIAEKTFLTWRKRSGFIRPRSLAGTKMVFRTIASPPSKLRLESLLATFGPTLLGFL